MLLVDKNDTSCPFTLSIHSSHVKAKTPEDVTMFPTIKEAKVPFTSNHFTGGQCTLTDLSFRRYNKGKHNIAAMICPYSHVDTLPKSVQAIGSV